MNSLVGYTGFVGSNLIDKGNFIDNFNDECVSFIMGIGNNINVYIVEVPNETAPSIQGFAKPPA